MGRIFHSVAELAGHTPLFEPLRFERAYGIQSHLLCKLEAFNPAGSIKDRAALGMIQSALEDGTLQPGDTIVEQTSGNTGIALASYAVPLGFHVEIFLEAGVTVERKKILAALGCSFRDYRDVLRVTGKGDLAAPFDPFREATLEEIRQYCRAMGPSFHFLNQCTNRSNPLAHIRTTGPEIWEDAGGRVDALVCMVGTGGTLLGLSTYLRQQNPDICVIAAEPAPCSRRCRENPTCNIIDGVLDFDTVPAKELTDFIRESSYDECMEIVTEDAYRVAQAFASLEGILIGTSGAAALLAACRLSRREAFSGKNIAVVIPDGGGKYLSCPLYTYERDLS